MAGIDKLFSSLGVFTAAFGMDKLNFGTLIGYYSIECGNVLGLGGAFFSSLCAANILSKEEEDHTAEFLMAHPVSRTRIVTEKLIAVLIQIAAMNLIANTAKSAAWLKNITPFGYCDGAEIVSSGGLDTRKIAIGLTIGITCVIAAYIKYGKKDIQ